MSERFWSKVKRGAPDECWPWVGFRKSSGHGLTSYKSMPCHASRKAWILTHGPISSELCVNHRCDNASCCNPSHMYLGSRADNMVDLWNKTPPDERIGGRKCVLTDKELDELWKMRRSGALLRDCANHFGVHIATICRYITARRKLALKKFHSGHSDRIRSRGV